MSYVIKSNSHHDLSPNARLDVRHAPVTVKGKAVNTVNAEIRTRALPSRILATSEGVKSFERLSKTQAGRKRLLSVAYHTGKETAEMQGAERTDATKAGQVARWRMSRYLKGIGCQLKQYETYARVTRQGIQYDRTNPLDSLFMDAAPIPVLTPSPIHASGIGSPVDAPLPRNARPHKQQILVYLSRKVDGVVIGGEKYEYQDVG